MDKTELVAKVSNIFRISGYKVDTSVKINHREIDIRAEETQGLVRKIILIECADYDKNVGVDKVQSDIRKLRAAKEVLKDNAIIMHVSRNGYTPDAFGYAKENGVSIYSLEDLTNQLINFDDYIQAIENDKLRPIILKEYQPNKIYYEQYSKTVRGSITFLKKWLDSDIQWLTLLGDYGVGKSWTLKRFLYELIEDYKKNPSSAPLPFFKKSAKASATKYSLKLLWENPTRDSVSNSSTGKSIMPLVSLNCPSVVRPECLRQVR